MSKIEITADNIKKFSKRMQKNAPEFGAKLTLSAANELLAKTLGANNYHDLVSKLEVTSEPKEAINKIIMVDPADSDCEKFLKLLHNILMMEESSIATCYLTEHFNNSFKLKFISIFGDEYSYTFDGGESVSTQSGVYCNFLESGFSKMDAGLISTLFFDIKYLPNIDFSSRFDSIRFGKNLFNHLNEIKKYSVKAHVLKCDESSPVNKDLVNINGIYYVYDEFYMTKNVFDTITYMDDFKMKELGLSLLNKTHKRILNSKYFIDCAYHQQRASIENTDKVFVRVLFELENKRENIIIQR